MEEIGFKQDSLHPLSAPHIAWNTVAAVILATALVAVCAHISMPLGITPIPVTMQTFAVLLLGLLFSPGAAFACLALYLMEGALGLPVFSPHGLGGMAQLLGPTGGYLLSYPFAAALASVLYRRGRRSFLAALAGLRTRQHSHPCRRLRLARAAYALEVFCCFRSIDRTVPSRRCRQGPRRNGLRQHAWIVRQ